MGHPVSPPAPGAASKNAGRKLVVIDALNVGRSYNVGFTCPEHHHFKIHKQHSWKAVPCCATAIALAIDYFLSKGNPSPSPNPNPSPNPEQISLPSSLHLLPPHPTLIVESLCEQRMVRHLVITPRASVSSGWCVT